MSRAVFLVAFLLTALSLATTVQAADVLGTRIVKYGADVDVIPAPGPKRYEQIRVCAYDNDVRLREIVVAFRNGQRQVIHVNRRINAGTCTPWYALRGSQRNIRRDIRNVTLRYSTAPNIGPRAKVTVKAR